MDVGKGGKVLFVPVDIFWCRLLARFAHSSSLACKLAWAASWFYFLRVNLNKGLQNFFTYVGDCRRGREEMVGSAYKRWWREEGCADQHKHREEEF